MLIYNRFYLFLFVFLLCTGFLSAQKPQLSIAKKTHLLFENENNLTQPNPEWGFWDRIYTLNPKTELLSNLMLDYKGQVLQTLFCQEKTDKKGTVKILETQKSIIKGEQNFDKKISYNVNNQLIAANFYYENGQFWKKETYSYYDNHWIRTKSILNPENQPTETWSYEYDSLNNLTAIIYEQPQQKNQAKTFFEYKDAKILTAIFEYQGGELQSKQTFDYGADSISTVWTYDSRLVAQTKDSLIYNEKSQLIAIFYWEKNPASQQFDKLFKKEKLSYNADNQLIERLVYDQTGSEIGVQHWDYNEKKQLLALRQLDTLGNELKRKTLIYNEKNQLTSEKQTVAQYTAEYESEEFNPKGKSTKKFFWLPNSQTFRQIDYYYDQKQQLISTETYLYPNNQALAACQKGENKQLIIANKLIYDDKNRLKEENSEFLNLETKMLEKSKKLYIYPTPKTKTPFIYALNSNGDTSGRSQYFFDKKGNLQKTEIQSYTENQPSSLKRIFYYKNGQELRTEVEKEGKISIRRVFEYDKNDNCTSQIYRNADEEIIKTMKVTYRYDKKGNFTSREIELNGKLEEILTRKIIYYK